MSGPTVLQSNAVQNFPAGTANTASFVTLPGAGHTVAVVATPISGAPVTSVTDNQSNTYVRGTAAGTYGMDSSSGGTELWWCQSIGTPSGTFTVTVNTVGTPTALVIAVFELSTSAYLDMAGIAYGGNNDVAALTATGMYADTVSGDLVIAAIDAGSSGSALATPASYTSVYLNNGNPTVSICYLNTSSNATPDSAAWSWTGATACCAFIASFSSSLPANVPYPVQFANAFPINSSPATAVLYGVNAGNTILVPTVYEDTGNAGGNPSVSDGTSYTVDLWKAAAAYGGAGVFSLWNATAGTHTVVGTKAAGATGSNVSFGMTALEVTRLPTVNSLDTTGSATAASTGPITATTGTLAKATDFVVVAGGGGLNSYTEALTGPSGWVTLLLSSGGSGAAQYGLGVGNAILVPGATTALGPSLGSYGSSHNWSIAITAYKPLAAAGGGAGTSLLLLGV